MRISSVSSYIFAGPNITNKKYEQHKVQKQSSLKQIAADTVSFGSVPLNPDVRALKSLLNFKIPDLYSDVILLPANAIKSVLDNDVFSPTLQKVVKSLKPFKESLFPMDEKLYLMLREESKKHPMLTLNSYLKSLVPQYHTQLLKTQRNVFDGLNSFSSELPADLLEQYNYLLYLTNQKLENKHIFIPFSIKEFKYKLSKIAERIGSSKQSEEGRAMGRLSAIASSVVDIPKEQRLNPHFKIKKYEDKQKVMIGQFRNALEHSVLKNDRDLLDLLKISEQRIYKQPTIIPFNRKSFIYDIKKITSRLSDTRLAAEIEAKAVSLPTSKEDLSALVIKESDRSAKQVVYDMLCGAVGSVDHLMPSRRGGKNSIYNYALTSSYMNSKKAHTKLGVFMREDPDMPRYFQKHLSRLIHLANQGYFERVDLERAYIINLANRLEQLSGKKLSLNHDTNRLLY